jgi:hypothetical protein
VVATLRAKSLEELHVPRKLLSSDMKLSVACVTACGVAQNHTLVEALRKAGREFRKNGSDVANGRQCLWIIYKYFASPNACDIDQGLSPNYSVLDLALIKLQGGDEGLETYWTKWTTTITNIPDKGGRRSVFQHLFVDEMRDAPLMETYVLACDEADPGAEKHTWEWLLMKGQASFQRERERQNLARRQKTLRGATPLTTTGGRKGPPVEDALAAYEIARKSDQSKTQQPTTTKQQPAVNDTTEQPRRGQCWFWNRGSCSKKNCQRDHELVTEEERAKVPDSFWNKGRKETSNGQGSDTDGNESAKGGGADNRSKVKGEGKGPKIVGCRYVNVGEVCPHGEKCRYKWARDKPPLGPPIEFDRRPVRERRKDTPGPIAKEEISDNDLIGSAASSSGSAGAERGFEPKMSE